LTSRLNLEAVLDAVVQHALSLAQADHATIYLYDESQDDLCYGTDLSCTGMKAPSPLRVKEGLLTAKVARAGKAAILYDARRHNGSSSSSPPGASRQSAPRQVGAIASLPLLKSERVLGVLDISFREPHPFTRDKLRILSLLADQAALAIENAQLYADAQRAQEIKNEFIRGVSHKLKTPMTSIHGYAKLMDIEAGGPITEQQRAFLDIIEDNVQRINQLINELDGLCVPGSRASSRTQCALAKPRRGSELAPERNSS
jgi:GAF domain-containing protein